MKLQILSDIHIDYNTDFKPTISKEADYILFAGDFSNLHEMKLGIKQSKVIYCHGNHDYYNEQLTNHNSITIIKAEKVIILACTFWTNFNNNCPLTKLEVSQRLNDYRYIQNATGTRSITPEDIYEQHISDFNWIKENLANFKLTHKDYKIVIMTHHSPTRQSISEKYRSMVLLNAAFSSDYDEFIINHPEIVLWVFGHQHNNFDTVIGTTRLVCNPKGYGNENPDFEAVKIVEI